MFLDLINLYNKHSNKTPLEDFNTECFANILRLYGDIKHDFILNFLQLEDDSYVIKTQLKKDLPDDPNCIIDLVFIGNKNICFIENKVESHEGDEQLIRYGKVLDLYYSKLEKHLCYCTKYSDVKNISGEYSEYNFKQFMWFEIAKFLRKHENDNPLIKDYLKFLNYYKMGQDNTIKAENLLSMENMLKTIEILEFHIDKSKEKFISLFGSNNLNKNFNWDQLKAKNRFCYLNTPVLNSDRNAWSEVGYSIDLGDLKLYSKIYVVNGHEAYDKFTNLQANDTNIKTHDSDLGFAYYICEDLGKFLNNINSDIEIKEWFINSFEILKGLITDNQQLNWNENLIN